MTQIHKVIKITNIFVVVFSLVSAASAQSHDFSTPVWVYEDAGFTVDGLAWGQLHSRAGTELVVISQKASTTGTVGKATILDSQNGQQVDDFQAADGRQLRGVVLVEQLDNGVDEFLVGESMSVEGLGGVYGLHGTGAIKFVHTPRGYPGAWNMGPSSGDVLPKLRNELIVPSRDGILEVLQRKTNGSGSAGSSLFVFDAYTGLPAPEHLYGHAVVADVDNNGDKDIVMYGAANGQVFALTPRNEAKGFAPLLYSSSIDTQYKAQASGPAVADIDNDGRPEIVVIGSGTTSVIRAYDVATSVTGDCEYQWSPGGDHSWTSPVIGDVDGDGIREVVVFSSTGELSILSASTPMSGTCVEGLYEVKSQKLTPGNCAVGDLSGCAWFTPALGNIVGGTAPDIVVATFTSLMVVEVLAGGGTAPGTHDVRVRYQANDPTATFYPSAIIVRGNAAASNPSASVYVSGWINGKVYRFDTAGTDPVPNRDWHTFMGNNQRTGALP